MIERGRTYVVMGLLDADSIAYAIGCTIAALGGKVVYSVQNAIYKRRFLDASKALSDEERAALDFRYCDVTEEDDVRRLFAELGDVAGVVHSIAYANPKTCLGQEFHTDAVDDIKQSYEVSCVSLATVARHAVGAMPGGGAIVALSFDTAHVYPLYNWMGVHKAALEALVRALARRHGRDGVRVNTVSAGPLHTKASSRIPGFGGFTELWERTSPLGWDPVADRAAVADTVAYLVGPRSAKVTGQTVHVDGGALLVRGALENFERPAD